MKKGFIVVLSLLLAWSCKKDGGVEQNAYSDQPIFYLNAVVDGLPISLKAGENQYSMFTGYALQDSVLHMQGVLAQDSPNFRNAFYLDLRGADLMANTSQAAPSRSFRLGPIPIADPSGRVKEPNHYDYFFFPDSVNGHIPLLWKVEGNSYYGDTCHVWDFDVMTKPQLEVEMRSAGPLSCTPVVRHTINAQENCKGEIHVIKSTNNELQVEARARLGKVKKVDWFLDLQKISSGLNLNYQANAFRASYQLKAVIEFESGCTETIEKVVLPGGIACDINMDYRKEPHRKANPHNLNTVEIRYYDAQGKMYSSWYPNTQGSFTIESYNSYHDQNSMHAHQRFSFSGDAILKSADGSSVQLNSIFGIFALAHP